VGLEERQWYFFGKEIQSGFKIILIFYNIAKVLKSNIEDVFIFEED